MALLDPEFPAAVATFHDRGDPLLLGRMRLLCVRQQSVLLQDLIAVDSAALVGR